MVRERGRLGSSSSASSTHDQDHDHGSSSKSSRNRSKVFAKRSMSLNKKIFELATLCGLDACMIINGPNGEMETWPENRAEVETIVQRYKNMNEEDRRKHNHELSSFVIEKKKKLEIKIDKLRYENDSKSKSLYPTWNEKLDELSEDALREMRCSLESKLHNVKSRVKMMMNRGEVVLVDHQKENATTTSSTSNPDFVKGENFSAMGDLNYDLDPYIPSLVPQRREFFDSNSSQHHHYQQQQENQYNFLPIGGLMSSMYNPGFGMTENHHLHQYHTNLMGDEGNYSTNFDSLPPLPSTTIFSHHRQPQPLQACVPAPSFQIGDHDYFFDNIYSHHQQQQQDFDFMPINGGDTY